MNNKSRDMNEDPANQRHSVMELLTPTPALDAAASTYRTNHAQRATVPWGRKSDSEAVAKALADGFNVEGVISVGSSYVGKSGKHIVLFEIHDPGHILVRGPLSKGVPPLLEFITLSLAGDVPDPANQTN